MKYGYKVIDASILLHKIIESIDYIWETMNTFRFSGSDPNHDTIKFISYLIVVKIWIQTRQNRPRLLV